MANVVKRVGGPGTTQFIVPGFPQDNTGAPSSGFSAPATSGGSFSDALFSSGPSLISQARTRTAARNVSVRGGSRGGQTGTRITEFGRKDFNAALIDWEKVFNQAQQGLPEAFDLIEQFLPGGGFGAGLRQEATEQVRGGLARDLASQFASGASSISSARGVNVLAGSELTKQFANIEDLRAQLQIGSFSPFVQLLTNLSNVGLSRPTTGQFIDRIVTPEFGSKRSGTTTFRSR